MKNTFVWGFDKNCENIILDLQNKNVIKIKTWFKEFNESKTFCYNIFDFFTGNWLDKYKNEINYYTEDIKFNEDAYNKVYEKLYIFHDQYSRHDAAFQKNKLHSYINMFNLIYRFIYGIFEKEQIELVLLSNIPHEGPELIIYELAKFFNIKTIVLNQSPFPNKFFYMYEMEDYGKFSEMYEQNSDNNFKIEKTFKKEHWYMKNIKPYRFSFFDAVKNTLVMTAKSRKPLMIVRIFCDNILKCKNVKQYLKNLKKHISQVDYNKNFVYFPLHLQPELETSAIGGKFCDQLLAIEILSQLIPKDWLIYVKENPKQTEYMRSNVFFKRLGFLKNVKLTPLEENTYKLIEKSQFVATITGTAAWESISGGKPALIFGNSWFESLPGIVKYHKNFNLDDILSYTFDFKSLEQEINKLHNKMGNGVIDPNYEKLVGNYSKSENTTSVSTLLQELIQKD